RHAVDDHGPRRVRARRRAPQLAVDEVADAPEAEPGRDPRRDEIGDGEKGLADVAGEEPDRDEHADQAAVERHAAFPSLENVQRVREQVLAPGRIEDHVADAPADDHAERAVEDQVVDLRWGDWAPRL